MMKKFLFMLGMLALVSTTNANKINALDEKPYCESSDTNDTECDNESPEPDETKDPYEENPPVCIDLMAICTDYCWEI